MKICDAPPIRRPDKAEAGGSTSTSLLPLPPKAAVEVLVSLSRIRVLTTLLVRVNEVDARKPVEDSARGVEPVAANVGDAVRAIVSTPEVVTSVTTAE